VCVCVKIKYESDKNVIVYNEQLMSLVMIVTNVEQ